MVRNRGNIVENSLYWCFGVGTSVEGGALDSRPQTRQIPLAERGQASACIVVPSCGNLWTVHLISMRTVRKFIARHPDSEAPLKVWCRVVKQADWRHLPELKVVFPSADQVDRRTVFDIGKSYRLIARVNYQFQKVYVLQILTHGEYDKGKWKQ